MKNYLASIRAMSLIELLMVIAIVALMAALAVPAFSSISQGQGTKRAVSDISSTLELARSEAMAQSTWVWVGLADTSENGVPSLTVASVASRDGTTNTATNNLTTLTRAVRFEYVKTLPSLSSWATNGNTTPLGNGSASFQTTVQGKTIVYTNTLAFSPRGEATLEYNRRWSWVEIALREIRGTQENDKKTASIIVSGISGQQIISY